MVSGFRHNDLRRGSLLPELHLPKLSDDVVSGIVEMREHGAARQFRVAPLDRIDDVQVLGQRRIEPFACQGQTDGPRSPAQIGHGVAQKPVAARGGNRTMHQVVDLPVFINTLRVGTFQPGERGPQTRDILIADPRRRKKHGLPFQNAPKVKNSPSYPAA